MKKRNFYFLSLFFVLFNTFYGERLNAQGTNSSYDIAFVLRGYDSSCYYCDSIQFDLKAQELISYMNKLSFGKIKTYRTFVNGIDSRSPVYLQSLRDISAIQAALNGWPGSQWDWLRSRTDYWPIVPANYVPIVQNAIQWMQANKLDFTSWQNLTNEGIINGDSIRNNIVSKGQSSAADFLDQLRMPAGYNPRDYKYTQIVLNSKSNATIVGAGAQNRIMYLGVVDYNGNSYTDFDPKGVYVFYSPRRSGSITSPLYTSIHEGVHASGMGTHDVDGIERNLSVMCNFGNIESIDMLPAWDRYYWNNWLPQSTITTDSMLVSDLKGKGAAADSTLKFIHQLVAGDSLGRGGTYREKYDGNWYTYTVNSTGTLFFQSSYKKINNKQPINVFLDLPVVRQQRDTVSLFLVNDGSRDPADLITYTWYKDSVRITTNSKYDVLDQELKVKGITRNEEGYYYCVVSNRYGTKSSNVYKLLVPCTNPPAPIVNTNLTVCQNASVGNFSVTASSGNKLVWYGLNQTGGTGSYTSPILSSATAGVSNYYVSQIDTVSACESPRASIVYTVNATPLSPVVSANLSVCQNASVGNLSATASSGKKLVWYGLNSTGGTGSLISPVLSSSVVGSNRYYVSQIDTVNTCESPRTSILYTVNAIPIKPTIRRDSLNNIFTSTYGTIWFKDGVQINDTTQQIRPTSAGSYTAKTVTSGCMSILSDPYYYLVTDLYQIGNDEYVKLSPNPFVDQLKIDFKLNGIIKLNLELIDIASGVTVFSRKDIYSGTPLYFGQLNAGIYVVKLSSYDQKFVKQFKVIKMR
jgi:hypothetical protein